MKSIININTIKHLTYLIYACCIFFFSGIVNAADSPLIDSIDFDELKNSTLININFIMPVSVTSHFPDQNGKQLDISILPIANTPDHQLSITEPQQLRFKSNNNSLVQSVQFEPAGKIGNISIRFFKTSSYEILNQTTPVKITIKIKKKIKPRPIVNKPPSRKTIENNQSFIYSINLISSKTALSMLDVKKRPELTPYFLYTTKLVTEKTTWHRLRLGFYKSLNDAKKILQQLKGKYPNAWIDRAKGNERKHIGPWLAGLANRGNSLAFNQDTILTETTKPDSTLFTTNTQKLFANAKKAIINKQYRTAIRLLTRLLRKPHNESTEAAQELLGVAREKNRQIAHAIAEYRTYLKKYPKGEFAYRVKQRLDGLTSARKKSSRRLRRVKSKYRETPLQVYGSVFQFYRRDIDTTDPSTNITRNSSLSTDVSVSTRKRTKKYDLRSQFVGSYQYDLENSDQSQFRISSAYYDASDRKRIWNARIGRQSQSTGGVLGRFDGIKAGYRFSPKWKINAVTGFPVAISSSNQLNTDKVFYGASLDVGTFNKYWNGSIFFVNQTAYDLNDRSAVGAELRYLNPKLTVFGLLDYDIDYGAINIAQLISNIRLPNATTLNLVADYRNSPILTTSNALQGQTSPTLTALLQTYTEDEIRQLAEDRTAIFRSVSATLSKPLKKNLLMSLEFSASHLSSTPASGNVAATPSTGIEYFYGTQVIANNIFKKGDTTLFGIRYADTNSSQTTTLSLNSRYPYNKKWRLNPRLRIDLQSRETNSEIIKYRPSLRVDWRAKRSIKFEMEAGYEYSDITDAIGDREESSFFINMGYIADF